ncbi:acyltransferase [Candidatus Pelagibacter ubique]|nr:acyltransferase [Candidatus Pelagibacter ubique]
MIRTKYFYFIDFLRWVAAMGILIHHYKAHFPINAKDIKNSEVFSFLINNATIGSYGVWFFWCISGFVFTNILVNQKNTLLDFSIKRFARLYPLHFLTLVIITILEFYSLSNFGNHQIESNIYDLYHFILNLFFISEWGLQNGSSFNGVIWSVSIELPVYFAFFYIVYFFNKNLLIHVFIILIILKLLLHTNLFYYHLKACFFYFLFGFTIYLSCLKLEMYNKFLLTLSIFGILSWPFLAYLENLEDFKIIKNFLPTTLVLFCSLIIFAFSIEKYYTNIGKKLSFLGNSSYAIYLTHLPVQIFILILFKLNFFEIQIFFSFNLFISYLILINVISILTFKYFENPIRKKINSFNK